MNNPLPRTNSLFAKAVAPQRNQDLAASVPVNGITPQEEAKANALVASILDSAFEASSDSNDEDPVSDDTERAESENNMDPGFDNDEPPAGIVYRDGRFRIPDRETSGLVPMGFELDESQLVAVEGITSHQYACLIGAAGTGKTSVQKFVIDRLIYDDPDFELKQLPDGQGLNIAMLAFTGMAVQVMKRNLPDWMQTSAKTIHAFLEFAPEQLETKSGGISRIFMPQRHNLRKCDHDIIIIDEASMLGLDLWLQLIAALKPGTRIYMCGDLNQLPPIIGQPIFAYALSRWPVYELTKVHRQKEAGANRIIEVAHQILNGKKPTFDVLKDNPDWRVIYQELDAKPEKANQQILAILNQLRKRPISPDQPDVMIYNPYADRVMTAGNGFDDNVTSSLVQQAPLNEALSILIQPPDEDHPRYIIDAGRSQKKFAVNLRVMATKNETMNKADRVTNGLAGVITDIKRNPHYKGRADLFGIESDVIAATRARIKDTMLGLQPKPDLDMGNFDSDDIEEWEMNHETEEELEGGGAASHIVTVKFDNGAIREYGNKAGVDALQLAFCSTVAKCQGSQFDTAIIICHHAQKAQLSREWLYTAVTRAAKRVIVLGTDYAMRYAIARQKIHGATLADKVEAYRQMASEGRQTNIPGVRLKVHVPLTIEDYTSDKIQHEYLR